MEFPVILGVSDTEEKTNEKSKLEQIADEALVQIRERNYIEGARKRGVKTIFCYGIGFYKAELMVKMEKIELHV